jgi:CO/xanthine dehydrogenase FAD-binding subunit
MQHVASVNIQFRMDRDVVAYVESHGVKASQLAKEAFEREVHRMRAEDHAKAIAAFKIKLPKGFAERVIREARDSR